MVEFSPFRSPLDALVTVLFLVPVIPIVLGWRLVPRLREGGAWRRPVQFVLLVLLTVSTCLLLSLFFTQEIVGYHHTERRFTTIAAHLSATATTTIVAIPAGGRARLALVTAGAWLTCMWLYVRVVSPVV